MNRHRLILKVGIPSIVVLFGLLVYQYVFLGFQVRLGALSEVEAVKTRTLLQQASLIAALPELEARLAQLKESRKTETLKLIEAQTISLAAAAIQNTVKGLVTARGGTISSERVEKAEDRGGFKVVSTSVDANLPDAKALEDVLFSVETRTPYLVVREIDVRVKNWTEPRELAVKFKISALTNAK